MYTVANLTKGRLQQFCSSLTWLAKISVGLWGKVGQKRKCARDLEGEREAAATMLKATVVRGGEQQTSRAYLNLVCPCCLLSTPGSSGWLTGPDEEAAATPRLIYSPSGRSHSISKTWNPSPDAVGGLPLSAHNSASETLVNDISLILRLSVLDYYLPSFSHNCVRSNSYDKSLIP